MLGETIALYKEKRFIFGWRKKHLSVLTNPCCIHLCTIWSMPSSLSSNLSLCVNHGFGKGHIVLYICIYIYGKVASVKGVLHKNQWMDMPPISQGLDFSERRSKPMENTATKTHGKSKRVPKRGAKRGQSWAQRKRKIHVWHASRPAEENLHEFTTPEEGVPVYDLSTTTGPGFEENLLFIRVATRF